MKRIFVGCAESNYRSGRQGFEPEAIIIHIVVGSLASCDQWFRNPVSRVSAHYCVGKSGEIHQYVREEDTAFHAGVVASPSWTSIKTDGMGRYFNPNYYTIGIEHEGMPTDAWPDAQYAASIELIADIRSRFPKIKADRDHIVMHREIRATKSCPGTQVDMHRLITGAAQPGPSLNGNAPKVIEILKNVNLRLGQPSTTAPVVRILPAGTAFTAVAYATGDLIRGNNIWYAAADGNYIWAGTTSDSTPPAGLSKL